MEFVPLPLPGLVLLKPQVFRDQRGSFIKDYNRDLFLENGIDFIPQESFYSVSDRGVLRGMHFLAPESQYGKLVHCLKGSIYDVALDLRKSSPTYRQSWAGNLDDTRREAVYLPPGFAHGFYSLESDTIVSYLVSHGHDPSRYQGVHWNSFGHAWPCIKPVISERDRNLPPLPHFISPFA